MPIKTVSKMLGHTKISAIQVYVRSWSKKLVSCSEIG